MENYNEFASEYNELSRKTRAIDRDDPIYFLLGEIKGKKVLDVGCGAGADAKAYLNMGAMVWGVDISKKQIKIATKNIRKGIFAVCDMAKKMPFEDNFFDVVVSRYAIQATEDVKSSILEMIRIAKPGADIIILAKHPTRTLLEGYINDKKQNYFKKGIVTSYLFGKKIKLSEPSHTLEEYLNKESLANAQLEFFKEGIDFPGSDRVIKGLTYPTFMILKFKKMNAMKTTKEISW